MQYRNISGPNVIKKAMWPSIFTPYRMVLETGKRDKRKNARRQEDNGGEEPKTKNSLGVQGHLDVPEVPRTYRMGHHLID